MGFIIIFDYQKGENEEWVFKAGLSDIHLLADVTSRGSLDMIAQACWIVKLGHLIQTLSERMQRCKVMLGCSVLSLPSCMCKWVESFL